ncbi:MAG: hypothetical protein ABI591_11145 [Kofleriaceae bacterium]
MLVGCLQDHYRCEVDTDCNLDDGGRCEANRYCTHFDSSCQLTQRSYTDHSDELSGTCFVGEATPLDLCATGQPPALPTGCGATVCTTLPACCTTGWSEACVLAAQLQCPEVVCDTRIALTATRGAKLEIFDLRYDGSAWAAPIERPDLATVGAYLAPSPGAIEPRFAGFVAFDPLVQTGSNYLTIESSTGTQTLALDNTRDYHDIASLDFDRDLRDTLVLDWQDATARTQSVQVWKLAGGDSRDLDTGVSSRMAWGAVADANGFVDGYPDGVAGNANAYKTLIDSESNQSKDRTLDTGVASQFDTNNTAGAGGALHSFTWADLDGDGVLDLVAFGNSIRVHTGAISETPFVDLDCNPPSTACPAPIEVAYNAGAVLPTPAGARIVAAPFLQPPTPPARYVYEIDVHPDHTISYDKLALPPTTCMDCAVEAIIVRDFDGDHLPDLLVIEDTLTLDLARSSVDPTLHTFDPPVTIPSTSATFSVVRTSVSGMPR